MPKLPVFIRDVQLDVFVDYLTREGAIITECTAMGGHVILKYVFHMTEHWIGHGRGGVPVWGGWANKHYKDMLAGRKLGEAVYGMSKRQQIRTKHTVYSDPDLIESPRSEGRKRARQQVIDCLASRDGRECWFCGKRLAKGTETIEHLLPRAIGGGSSLHNLALACSACNLEAADKPLVQKIALRERKRAEARDLLVQPVSQSEAGGGSDGNRVSGRYSGGRQSLLGRECYAPDQLSQNLPVEERCTSGNSRG